MDIVNVHIREHEAVHATVYEFNTATVNALIEAKMQAKFRSDNGIAVVAGQQTIPFDTPMTTTAYSVMANVYDSVNGQGVEASVVNQSVNGFDINCAGDGVLNYDISIKI